VQRVLDPQILGAERSIGGNQVRKSWPKHIETNCRQFSVKIILSRPFHRSFNQKEEFWVKACQKSTQKMFAILTHKMKFLAPCDSVTTKFFRDFSALCKNIGLLNKRILIKIMAFVAT
jgi:hypothetical protein